MSFKGELVRLPMPDSVEGGGANGRGSDEQALEAALTPARAQAPASKAAYAHARAYDHALTYAHLRAYVSLAVKASGLVALLLSTVILLGGYVQSLVKEDFFCIMTITVIQAAGIFQDWETNLEYFLDFWGILLSALGFLIDHIPAPALVAVLPLSFLIICFPLSYFLGPLACAAISSWRIAKLNHGNNMDGTDSMANMMATLHIFYSLIIFQGTMVLVLIGPMDKYEKNVTNRLHLLEQLSEEWAKNAIHRYISHISEKCWKDSLSIKGRDLVKYAAELLDSESQEDYLYGARLLSAFIKKGEDVRWLLLPSRHRIQRLIDSLMISSSSSPIDEACVQISYSRGRCIAMIGSLEDKKEIREHAATIVADVAAHIDDLSNYPGAMRCISSLFQDPDPDDPPLHQQDEDVQRLITGLEYREERRKLMMDQHRMAYREHRHRNKREGGTSNELVQQGLTILERLASNNDDNRRIICSTPGLLPKITAPVYSATLIQDVKSIPCWAVIVTRCFKVLYQLIRGPDGSYEIFSNNAQSLSNLRTILELGNNEADHQGLQLVAMKILTELPLDLSIKLNEEIQQLLITKQLQLFLANEDGAAMAGRTLLSLSNKSERISAPTMTTQNSIIGRLTGILDDENSITRRTIAAGIMANLYAHCNVDNTTKGILLKVLRKIMSIKTKSQEREVSAGQNNPAASGDEENQGNSVSTNNEERQSISTDGNDAETEEISDQEREEQEAFLSLAQVICDKLDSANLDGAIQSAVDQNSAGSEEQRREVFVDKLKTIIDNNCHPAADSLRIVKFCGRIAVRTMMQCEQYAEIFRNKGFKSSLSEASKTMSELESCMLFVGTDFGPKKTVRPLLSEIEESFGQT